MKATITLNADELDNIIRSYLLDKTKAVNKITNIAYIVTSDMNDDPTLDSVTVSVELN